MVKRVVVGGLLGFLVIVLWGFVVNGLLGFRVRMDMKQIPQERRLYEVLKETVPGPGHYICNPERAPEAGFPPGQPAYGVLYGGVGHEAAGRMEGTHLVLWLAAPLLGACLLASASRRVLERYSRRVLFFCGLGLLLALWGPLMHFGIADYPFSDALLQAGHDLLLWCLVGLVVAWRVEPDGGSAVVQKEGR